MELKKYQKRVINELTRYLEYLTETYNLDDAWHKFWESKGIHIGLTGLPDYRKKLSTVINICFKIPTGGGKTFLACNSIEKIFNTLPSTKIKAVVWLVPSESILSQTLKALKDSDHPYRQKLNSAFGNRVEVYTKDELLNGQNFNSTTISEQLSVMVLSYDSFKRNEGIKSKRENSALAPMAKALGKPLHPIESADETSLIQTINQLNPLVIVDESHHAGTKLSRQMLKDFNPCFVLELTATPQKDSNILCYVSGTELKRENMVKLPVIVFNRNNQQEVLVDAIDLRNRLEECAKKDPSYPCRPIVLFQAEPKIKDDSTTFEKLKRKLIEIGIPANQIAIKTSDVNDLQNVDLMSSSCSIRYIITVNALKEGWDCPFAYVLASLSNKTSQVDVEQILGRVLRQPYAHRYEQRILNMCYVLTCSASFKNTLDSVVKGLNGAGFSGKEYRIAVEEALEKKKENSEQLFIPLNSNDNNESVNNSETKDDEFSEIDTGEAKKKLENRSSESGENSSVDVIINTANQEGETTTQDNDGESKNGEIEEEEEDGMPPDVKINRYPINNAFREEIRNLLLPIFFHKTEEGSFFGSSYVLSKENLSEGFSLKGKATNINFRGHSDIYKVDVNDNDDNVPSAMKLVDPANQHLMKEMFSQLSSEQKIRACKDILYNTLNKIDAINAKELRNYINRIVDDMDSDTQDELEKNPYGCATCIKTYIDGLMEEHRKETFNHWIETGDIVCEPAWSFPETISPTHVTMTYGKSLYHAEEAPNAFETEMIQNLTGLDNIKWWHRNIARKGFCINGYINHYPDFIIMTKKGCIILAETKGTFLDNEDSRNKLALGRKWQDMAEKSTNKKYRYYMVFQKEVSNKDGSYTMNGFLNVVKEL